MLNKELDITVNKLPQEQLKAKPDQNNLGFGQFFTDHMFSMRWNKQHGWHDAQIGPYQSLTMDPAAMVLHYGQAIFEGMKAYKNDEGRIQLFRPSENFARMNKSAVRMCMPRFPEDTTLKALRALLYLDQAWVPETEGATLYIRPTMIATEPMLGLRPAEEYLFYIINCPVGAYYSGGFSPTKIYVEDKYIRAVPGGVGDAKTAGNYAASLKAQLAAQQQGFTQVLWLDAKDKKYIEEVGTSNIFFVIDNTVITPPLEGSILPGITRNSVLQLIKDWGMKIEERRISIDEIIDASANGTLQESFGTGTAAVIAPVGELFYQNKPIIINEGKTGPVAQKLFDELQAIQFGKKDDSHGWVVPVA